MPNYTFDNQNDLYDLTTPSLADIKSIRLNDKLAQKKDKLTPTITSPIDEVSLALQSLKDISRGSDGLLAMGKASLFRGAGNVADSYANIQQNVLGNKDYALSPEINNLSNTSYSDQKARFTGRDQYNEDVNSLSQSVANNEIGSSLFKAVKLGPRALFDSAASGAELLAGSLATAGITAITGPVGGAIAGGAVFGRKAKKLADATETVVTMSSRIAKGAKAVPTVLVKTASRTSLLTADLTEQMRQDYISANGTEPTASWYALNVPLSIALNTIELGILSKAVPKFNTGIIKDLKNAIKSVPEGKAAGLAKNILNGSAKVASSAGAEAGQEYLQTWQEILAPVVKGDTLSQLISSSVEQWNIDNNQTQSIVGSLLGGSAGGSARGISVGTPIAAKIAVKTSANLAKGVVKGVSETLGSAAGVANRGFRKSAAKVNVGILSQEERDTIRKNYEVDKAVIDEKIAEIDSNIEVVKTAKSFNDVITDPNLKDSIITIQKDLKLTDEDLKTPSNFNKLKDRLLKLEKSKKITLQVEITKNVGAELVKASGKNIKKTVASAFKKAVPKKVIESAKLATAKSLEIAITSKDITIEVLKSLKDIKSSTAVAVIDMAINSTKVKSSKLINKASELNLKELNKVQQIVEKANPSAGKLLKTLYEKKKSLLKEYNLRNDNIVNKDNIPVVLTSISDNGNIEGQSAPSVAKILNNVLASKITDIESLTTIKSALKAYKNSNAYNDPNGVGKIDELTMTIYEDRIASAEKRIGREINQENVTDAATATVDKIVEVSKAASKAVEPIAKSVTDTVKDVTKKSSKVVEEVLRDNKKLPEGNLKKTMAITLEQLKADPSIEPDIATNAKTIVKKLNSVGYETINDFNDLVKEFPKLKKYTKLYKSLKDEFKPNEKESTADSKADTKKDDDPVFKNTVSTPVDTKLIFEVFDKILNLTECKK